MKLAMVAPGWHSCLRRMKHTHYIMTETGLSTLFLTNLGATQPLSVLLGLDLAIQATSRRI